ncbi:hypothetical protein QUW44_06525 [Limosilactobacillus pontis]|uniref:Uncharacterized protein n=1 Tax=Limosilactobacillus pontis TaxID=35787 RepID=A0ABT7UYN3_9LACO|nr:hypothetical protein [Limosilactobacillus pontis]MDM8266816.1 hypothetical protein [Limosilactobacillus pontis]
MQKLADFYSAQEQTNGVKVDFSDMNNRYIDVSGVAPDVKVIYVSVPVNYLSDPQPLTIKGLSSSENGPVVIVNVDLGSQANEYRSGRRPSWFTMIIKRSVQMKGIPSLTTLSGILVILRQN